ncbi:unnamed protein product, partial [Leptidea sinapis]
MSDSSSDSEEFYDAEDFTPAKGSKRSSLCKSISISEKSNLSEKEKTPTIKTEDSSSSLIAAATKETPVDEKSTVKNVVQGRRRFQELRRCMQTEEEDDNDAITPAEYTYAHPFKIISHDTMSMQSMTSLGRIGRILSGAAESHPNIRDNIGMAPSATSREPSTISDEPTAAERPQNG